MRVDCVWLFTLKPQFPCFTRSAGEVFQTLRVNRVHCKKMNSFSEMTSMCCKQTIFKMNNHSIIDSVHTSPIFYLLLFVLMSSLTGCASLRNASEQFSLINPNNIPKTPREMRGVWVATVDNIDWPSKPGLPVKKQKAELIAIMNKAKELNLNAIFFRFARRQMLSIIHRSNPGPIF